MRRADLLIRAGILQVVIVLSVTICPNAGAQAPNPPPVRTGSMPLPVAQPNGDVIVLPQHLPASRRTGLLVSVDTRWVNAYGYRPIEVTISSPLPAVSAHIISVQLHSGWDNIITAEQDFELPSGATKASAIVALPFYEQSVFGVWWEIRVDGVKDTDLSMDREGASRRVTNPNVSASTIRILIPGSPVTQKALVSSGVFDFEVLSLTLDQFPRRWIDYSCLDVVSLSVADLEQVVRTNPAALEAIERWVRAGGQLWVSDVGDKLEKLPEISKHLKVPDAQLQVIADPVVKDPNEKTNDKPNVVADKPADRPAEVGWRPGRFRGAGPPGQSPGVPDGRPGRGRWFNDPSAADDPNAERRWPQDSSQWYVEQRLGLGTLRAFRGVNEAAEFARTSPATNANAPANAETGQVPRALAVGLRATRRWDTRHGLIPDSSNAEFAKLLVPGVGLAPVTEFQVLITLFVLLIGPFNYWILKRYKRLQMLVLTVPLSAGVATAALFAYAIVSDGFATKVRARSYTTIDQSTGEAACWARMSYYAGLAPSAGLAMPADIVMYPILPSWGGDDWGTNRDIIWDENLQQLTRGWLTSRTPTQYLLVRSRKTPHRLDVTSGNSKMQIVNRLGTQIESLLVLDDDGKFFYGAELENELRVALEPISRDDAIKRIVELMRDNEPEMPIALSGGDRDFLGRRGRTARRMFGRYHSQPGDSQLNENLASRALSDLAGMNGRPALELPAKSYVAVTATGPEVETGISGAKEDASFHVIVGRW